MTSGAVKAWWCGNSGRPVWFIQHWKGATREYRVYNHNLWDLIPCSKKCFFVNYFLFIFMEIAWWANLEGEKGGGIPL